MAEVVLNGVRHHVQRLGRGSQTVVFVHGLVMDNLASWYFTVGAPLAARADVVLYDLRGHGKSERPATGYALADLEADLGALVSSLQLDHPVHLVGNSFGGLLALSFALSHPEAVASLMLVDAHLGRPGWSDAMAQTLSLQGAEREERIRHDFQHWLGRHSERKSTRLASTALALVEQTSLIADLRGSPGVSKERVRELRCPTLALYGEQSDLRPDAAFLSEEVPRADVRIRPGCSHSLLWEATPWVRDTLLAWLAEHR
jgi:pimeloyl-ACP methyl ester carboxylesterase